MKKRLKYKFLSCKINRDTEEEPNMEPVLLEKAIECSEAAFESNLALAKAEAVGGEVTVEAVGEETPVPTKLDQMEAQLAYTAMMTDTLLEV